MRHGAELFAGSPAELVAELRAQGVKRAYIDGAAVGNGDIELALGSALKGRHIQKALLEADEVVPYGRVVQVIDIMNRAGVEQLGMVTKPRERSDAGRRR